MTTPRLIEARDGATAILTLDNPARRNALAWPLSQALADAMERIEADTTIRAVVLTGAGGTFCAGGDLSAMTIADLAAGRERLRHMHRLVRLLIRGAKPVLAAVEGFAVGAGLSLALCTDTIVAAADAQFGAGFGRVGLMPDLGMLHTLPLRVGQGRARQLMLYPDRIAATEAHAIGLADHVVSPGETLSFALARARTLTEMAPLSLAFTRQALAQGLEAVLEWERDHQAALFLTADHAEGKAAFFEKRSPVFQGR